jgi:hypothetical protein
LSPDIVPLDSPVLGRFLVEPVTLSVLLSLHRRGARELGRNSLG